MSARLWFAGTPAFAAHSLQTLINSGDYTIDGVLTQPDRPAGRGRKLTASAVKETALAHNLPVAQPEKLHADAPPFAELPRPDLIIVAAYGLLLPPWFLAYPRLGCLNIHASLLPRWRGAAPIQRAIEAGDAETGVCIMQMDAGLDTGAVVSEHRYAIGDHDSAQDVHDALMELGAAAIVEDLQRLEREGSLKAVPQPENGVSYAAKFGKEDAHLDWNQDAALLLRKIRAFNPMPAAWVEYQGKPLKIWRAEPANGSGRAGSIIQADAGGITVACGSGALRITELQAAGSRRMDAAAFLAGHALGAGDML